MSRKLRNGLIGAAAGLGVAALLVPTIAGGNARPKPPTEVPLVARLTGAAEVPGPGDVDGTGAVAITIDPVTDELCYDLAVGGISTPTAAHIHEGAVGTAPPMNIRVTLAAPTTGTSSACIINAETIGFADLIAANPQNFYVNVHTADFGAGAVRGQLAVGPASNNTYVLGEPVRAYDSRNDTAAGKLTAGQTRTISLQSGVSSSGTVLGVPAGATAALVTLTITETEGAGFVKIYSNAVAEPPTSNINWSQDGQNLAVATVVAVDALSQVKVTGGNDDTHVVLDVTGFLY